MTIQYNMTIIKTISNNMKSWQIDTQNDYKCRYRSKKRQAEQSKERKLSTTLLQEVEIQARSEYWFPHHYNEETNLWVITCTKIKARSLKLVNRKNGKCAQCSMIICKYPVQQCQIQWKHICKYIYIYMSNQHKNFKASGAGNIDQSVLKRPGGTHLSS